MTLTSKTNLLFSPILQTFCIASAAALLFLSLPWCAQKNTAASLLGNAAALEAAATASEGWVAGLMVDEANFSKAELTTVNLSFE